MRVEAMAFFRLIRSVDAITIELPRDNAAHPNAPNVASPITDWIEINDSARRRIVGIPVKLQANTGRVTADQNETDSVSLLMRTTNRKRRSRLDVAFIRRCRETMRHNFPLEQSNTEADKSSQLCYLFGAFDGVFDAVCLFHPWKREWSPAFHASRRPGELRSQSGRTSLVTMRRSRQRSAIDGRPQNQ